MTDDEFIHALRQKTRREVARELASPILFSVKPLTLCFVPETNTITPYGDPGSNDEHLTIHCVSWERLYQVLVGEYDLMAAFLDKEIWTNGYLPQVFRLFAVFQPALTTQIPE